jgi:4-amino-4-deoxy-L-arabinose transferase-like glycosyltransferase
LILSRSLSPRGVVTLFALLAVLWFANLEYVSLLRPDEGRNAEIAREMTVTGDWVTPRVNGVKYFDKPPLQYWATAIAFDLFGEDEWTARLWTASTGFLGILLTFALGARLYGARAGLFSAVVLASSLLYGAMGHISTLDMGVTLFLVVALAAFIRAEQAGIARGAWLAVAWAALAASVLSKGLIGIVIPAGAFGLYMIWQRDWGLPRRLITLRALALFAAMVVPWFALVSARNPEFAGFFFVHEHFQRFLTPIHQRHGAPWYFLAVLLLGTLPWTFAFVDGLQSAYRASRSRGEGLNVERLLLAWAAFVLVFFTLSSSKLPAYILPMFPVAALLAGRRLATLSAARICLCAAVVVAIALTLVILSPLATRLAPGDLSAALLPQYVPWATAASGALLACAAVSCGLSAQRKATAAVLALALGGLGFQQLALSGYETLASSSSTHLLGERIHDRIPRAAPVYSVDTFDHTLPFYLQRPVILVRDADELAFGLSAEPALWIPEIAAFEARWKSDPLAFAFMRPDTYAMLRAAGLPLTIIDRDSLLVVVVKPLAEARLESALQP